FGNRRLGPCHSAVRFEEYRRCNHAVEPALSDRLHCLAVEAHGVGILFAADVRRYRGFETMLAELLKHRGAKLGIVQWSRTQPNQRIPVRSLEPFLVSSGYPQREKP